MREAAIVSTARTGIGKAYRGAFNATEAPVLAGHVMNAAVARAGIDPARIDDIFWGVGNQWGTTSGNAGRMAVFAAGLPQSVPAFTLDRKCGSGLTSVALAARTIARLAFRFVFSTGPGPAKSTRAVSPVTVIFTAIGEPSSR